MPVVQENARRGETGWWGSAHAPAGAIEAYTAQPSVVAGDPLCLSVSTTPAARYSGRVYRLGWYGGAGARLVSTLRPNVGLARSAPPPDPMTGIVRAGWPVTDVITTFEEWHTGQYVIVLELTTGPHVGCVSRVPFVVRELPGDLAPGLVQMPVNTTQAYNHWGGKSLYVSGSTDGAPAVKVSFDRPVPSWEEANLNARAPFVYELPLIRWLEREGFEVAYQTDVDTHRSPHTLAGRRLLISAGHDEYWTIEMRAAFERALTDGTNLAFMGANSCYWQIRYEEDQRTIVEYRDAALDPEPDQRRKTIQFRQLKPAWPERELIGVQYEGGRAHPREQRDYWFVPSFAGDAWAAGIELDLDRPLSRTVGYEWDTFDRDHPPPRAVRILTCSEADVPADAVRWRTPSGAQVFAAGSLQLPWALDDWASAGTADSRLQTILRRGFQEMLD